MHLIDCDTAEAYLRAAGRIGSQESVRVRRLAGGVSNEVLLVECAEESLAGNPVSPRLGFSASRRDATTCGFVLKQARPQLRVADPWFCSVERIWREVETLRVCGAALEGAVGGRLSAVGMREEGEEWEVCVPRLLFEDRDNYAFAMTAAPPHEVWKTRLLTGQVEPSIAAACGRLLAALHAGTWRDGETATRLRDRSFFHDLRIDPYYRRVQQVHDDLEKPLDDLIHSLADNCLCLVHGDFSPKNLLVFPASRSRLPGGTFFPGPSLSDRRGSPTPPKPPIAGLPGAPGDLRSEDRAGSETSAQRGGLMLVDFEVGHFGDPAFDLGFFLSHLTLKAFWSGPRLEEYFSLTEAFWRTYREGMSRVAAPEELRDVTARAVRNFAACMLARVDGKSKVEYLQSESLRMQVRRFARQVLLESPPTWEAARERII